MGENNPMREYEGEGPESNPPDSCYQHVTCVMADRWVLGRAARGRRPGDSAEIQRCI